MALSKTRGARVARYQQIATLGAQPAQPVYHPWQPLIVAVPGSAAALAVVGVIAGLLSDLSINQAARWGLIAFTVPWALLALVFLAPLVKALIMAGTWLFERTARVDVTGDGYLGRPAQSEPGLLLINPRQGRAVRDADAQREYRQAFARFVHGCQGKGATALRKWEPVVGRERYTKWRDALIRAGYARWCNGRDEHQGWELVMAPGEIVSQMFDPRSPTPSEVDGE
jgi:hypothetical protein